MLNLTPVPRERYRIGVPEAGAYVNAAVERRRARGAERATDAFERVDAEPTPFHGYPQSIELTLPPLARARARADSV